MSTEVCWLVGYCCGCCTRPYICHGLVSSIARWLDGRSIGWPSRISGAAPALCTIGLRVLDSSSTSATSTSADWPKSKLAEVDRALLDVPLPERTDMFFRLFQRSTSICAAEAHLILPSPVALSAALQWDQPHIFHHVILQLLGKHVHLRRNGVH